MCLKYIIIDVDKGGKMNLRSRISLPFGPIKLIYQITPKDNPKSFATKTYPM